MKEYTDIIQLLSDGKFHSGEEIGNVLGISRSAVWKQIHKLEELHIPIHSVHGRGYCIPDGLELLSKQDILSHVPAQAQNHISHVDIFSEITSTNDFLLQTIRENPQQGHVCLAEQQTAGRGRCGRNWYSPFGKNIYLSLLWSFTRGPNTLEGLTLAVGVAIVRALKEAGIHGLQLKWPNDIYHNDKKLAGILVELMTDTVGVYHAVIGLGLNIQLSHKDAANIDRPWTDLSRIQSIPPKRNYLVGLLLTHLVSLLQDFDVSGFEAYRQEWESLDYLHNKPVEIQSASASIAGIAQGIDDRGGLLVKTEENTRSFQAGDVRVKC